MVYFLSSPDIVKKESGKLLKLTCFFDKDSGGKKMGVKQHNISRQKEFALISTVFIRWGCDFT